MKQLMKVFVKVHKSIKANNKEKANYYLNQAHRILNVLSDNGNVKFGSASVYYCLLVDEANAIK